MHSDDSGGRPGDGELRGIDWPRAHWLFRRTMRLWAGGAGIQWEHAAARAAAEHALGRWLAIVFGVALLAACSGPPVGIVGDVCASAADCASGACLTPLGELGVVGVCSRPCGPERPCAGSELCVAVEPSGDAFCFQVCDGPAAGCAPELECSAAGPKFRVCLPPGA